MKPISPRLDGTYILVCFIAVVCTFFFHELMHWLTGEVLGYQMTMTLNSAYPASGSYYSGRDYAVVSAAGPAFTMLQAIVCFLLMRRGSRPLVYPFLLTALYMRAVAAGLSFINPNDEARISSWLGIGTFTLPLIVLLFLLYLTAATIRSSHLSTRLNIFTLVFIIIFSSVLILSDMLLHVQII